MNATGEAASIAVGELEIRCVLESADSHGRMTMFECAVPAGAKVPVPHSHDGFEETIYGLVGVSTWTVDGETIEVGPGGAVCLARGSVHGFVNRSGEATKFLAVATPGVFGLSYFRELAAVLGSARGGPPDPAAIAEVMRRHGLTPAPPIAV
jgi:quercetin dioxygenase-like cupin family protein